MNMNLKEQLIGYNTESNFSIHAYIDKSGNPWFEGKEMATLL